MRRRARWLAVSIPSRGSSASQLGLGAQGAQARDAGLTGPPRAAHRAAVGAGRLAAASLIVAGRRLGPGSGENTVGMCVRGGGLSWRKLGAGRVPRPEKQALAGSPNRGQSSVLRASEHSPRVPMACRLATGTIPTWLRRPSGLGPGYGTPPYHLNLNLLRYRYHCSIRIPYNLPRATEVPPCY
eukprot:SAG31_NODE_4339_length_3340_cov_4.899389_2_plen_184_part_00